MATTSISPSASSASSVSPGVSNLLQTLQNVDGSIASSPALQAALEKAPPQDLVQLSVAATQLQNVGALFGDSTGSTTNPFTAGTNQSDFANLESVLTGSPTQSAQAAAQLQNVDSLFGIQDSTTANTVNPLSNLESLALGSSPSGASAQAAQFQQQIQNTQALFGIGSPGGSTANNLNLLG